MGAGYDAHRGFLEERNPMAIEILDWYDDNGLHKLTGVDADDVTPQLDDQPVVLEYED